MKSFVLCATLLIALCVAAAEDTTSIVVPPEQSAVAEDATKQAMDKCSDAMDDFKKKHEDDLEALKDMMGSVGDMLDKTRVWGEPKKATVIPLANTSPSDMARLLKVFDAEIEPQEQFKAISVKAAPDTLATIEQLVKRFDVPMSVKNVELQFYLLTADGGNYPVPEQLADVVAQIKKIYPNPEIAMAGSYVVRGCDGQGFSLRDTMFQSTPITFRGRVSVSGNPEGVQTIKLDEFTCEGGGPERSLWIQTDLAFVQGQSVVIGKSSVEGINVFVVVTGRVID
ncbi:MAG: hypothetical protein NTZ09_15625 [Candidatus Hydrogenedentes bacterium]|nr:hypothetical protein [Candidatus Hydrogenedentota bacterium]